MSSLRPMQESSDTNVRIVGDKMSDFLDNLRNKLGHGELNPQKGGGGGGEVGDSGVFAQLKNRLGGSSSSSNWRDKVHQRKKLFGL